MRASSRVLVLLLLAACGRAGSARSPADRGAFRAPGTGAGADPTVRGARLLPEVVDESQGYGSEPGGGVRAITAGLRLVTTPHGAILAAEERLPQAPQLTVALPPRLGGGFLFVLGTTVWRAEQWLAPARPIFASLQGLQAVIPGLDRVYLRVLNTYLAIDGQSGAVLDLGPWPRSPFVSGFAAADGWRAAAITDLRGAVATYDAGATWRALDLPMDPRQVLVSGDSLAIGGVEGGKTQAWFELRPDGSTTRLAGPPREAKAMTLPGSRPYLPGGHPGGAGLAASTSAPSPPPPAASREAPPLDDSVHDAWTRIFGPRPLVAAIEDGWPLTDGTAVVARDGALGRVRLSDGALLEVAQGAFPERPARCHPLSLTRPGAVGAFGFVCGEPRGATVLYAFDPARGGLTEQRRFDRPRVVTAAGNGTLAVRGPCAEDGDPSAPPREPMRVEAKDAGADDGGARATWTREGPDDTRDREPAERSYAVGRSEPETASTAGASLVHPYCIFGHDQTWRELHVRGDGGEERVVALADGRVAVVSPPPDQSAPARLTLLSGGRAVTLPVVFPKVTADVARVLRLGVWLEGFEERRPGVLGGWIEAGGALLGVEVALDGKATPGQLVRDAGMPFVSGRYGLGWTSSRRGYETTDGGITWTSLELPDPLVPTSKVERRACGPVGCLAAGWLRVGWGEAKRPPVPATPPPYRAPAAASPPQLSLSCEAMLPSMPPPPTPRPRGAATATSPTARPSSGGPPVLSPTTVAGVTELPAFFAQAGPRLRDAERGLPFEIQDLPERYPRLGALARVYAWGPRTGDWDTQGKWQVKWLSPFAGWTETRASLAVLPPQALLDLTKQSSTYGSYLPSYAGLFRIATGDDPTHALLLAQRPSRTEITPVDLEADRAPIEIRRADGEPFVEIDAVTRAGGRWYLATPAPQGAAAPTTTIYQVDGGVARELVRVARAAVETGRPTGTRLARRSDGRALGLVVDGQPTAERSTATRWVLPLDLETGRVGDPELLGYADLAGRPLEACTDDVVGWSFDTSLPSTTVRLRVPQGGGSLHTVYARVRLSATRACVERLAGTYPSESAAELTRPGNPSAPRPGELAVSVLAAQSRYALRCTVK